MIFNETSRLIIRAMRKFNRIMRENFEEQFDDMNITRPQGMVLAILSHHGEMKISDLSKKMYLSNSTVSGIIDRLEKNGFVERRRNKKDRRIVMVELKGEFKKEAQNYFKPIEDQFAKILAFATPEELEKMVIGFETLEKLMTKLKSSKNSQEY